MKIIVAPDKFKGSLDAVDVCRAILEGIQLYDPRVEAIAFPLADGGEGTADILTHHARGQVRSCYVHDPLFRPVEATFGLSADGTTAFVEMAQASGLYRLSPTERNAYQTTSLGTGDLIRAAVEVGATRLILGIGGSATNDGGIGMATALGYRFLDAHGHSVPPTGGNLQRIAAIDTTGCWFDSSAIEVKVACDVDNPLTGPQGASRVYGPQKGATAGEVEELEAGLQHLANLIRVQLGKDVEWLPGAGAAGGLGGGALAFLNAQLVSGVDLVMELTGFAARLVGASLVITGEGKIDQQTLRGKLILGVVAEATRVGVPTIAVCGTLEATPSDIRALGLRFAGSIINRPCSLEEAMQNS